MGYTREDGCRAWMTYGTLAPDSLEKLLEEYGSYEGIYDAFKHTQGSMLLHYANDQQMEILTKQARNAEMHEMMRAMQRKGMKIIAKDDAAYPELLRHIPDAPPLLFYMGNLQALAGEKFVTMVGSRRASFYGMDATRRIARELSQYGVVIVSGLAVGVDSAAHEGCLEGGSATIGVAACGLDVDYPAENAPLRRRILSSGGLLLSEAPPGTPALPWRFPIRNRILSGLSSATIMMEARLRSGTMTTVQHALDQGREVYAYPGDTNAPGADAARSLLREGANYFTSARDILEDMKWTRSEPEPKRKAPERLDLPELDEQAKTIYDLLGRGEKSFDQLAAGCNLDAQMISGALTILQIHGLIRPLPGKLYKRV